jgi:hypothetical protein
MRALLLALALALPAPLPAQTPTAGLRALLARLPAALVDPLANLQGVLGYGDPGTARALASRAGLDPDLGAWRALPPEAGDPPLARGAEWPARVGFGPGAVERMLALTLDGQRATLWQLAPGTGAAVAPALEANGYRLEERDGHAAWARGAQDHAIDLRVRASEDPFGGRLGQSQRVRIAGDLVIQTSGWDTLARLDPSDGPTADRATPLARVLDAIDALPGSGTVLGALVLPFAGDGRLHRPVAIPFPVAPLTEGPTPLWLSGVLADVALDGGQVAVLALAVPLPDAAAAHALRDRLAERWDRALSGLARTTMAAQLGTPTGLAVLPTADAGLWVMRLVLPGTLDLHGGVPRNTAWHRLLGMAMQGDLVVLPP